MSLTQTLNTVADLRLRKGAPNAIVKTLGYYTPGDGGSAQYYFDNLSVEADNGGTVIKTTALSGAGRWKLIHDGSVNVATFGVVTASTSENAQLVAALAASGVKEIVFNHLVTKSYTIDAALIVASGVVLKFENDNKLLFGTGSLSGGIIECNYRKQCFAGSLAVTNLENTEISAMWFGAKPDGTSSVTGTDNLLAAQKAVDSTTVPAIVRLPGTTIGTIYQYHYYFSGPWTISRSCEIRGDGYKGQTTLKFPGTGAGIILTATNGGQVLRNFYLRGAFTSESANYNSNTAHGITISSNDCTLDAMYVSHFDGDGFRVAGSVLNANSWKALNCRSYNNGRAGWYTDGSDANAGRSEGLVAQRNGRWGIWDDSLLGNIYDGGSVGTNTYTDSRQQSLVTYRAAVSQGGNRYRAIAASTNQVPPNATYWELIGVGGIDATYQAWSSTRAYADPTTYWARVDITTGVEPSVTTDWDLSWRQFDINPIYGLEWDADTDYLSGGAQNYQNLNARTLVDGVYNEGDGPVEFTSPGLVVGGFSAQHANNNAIWGGTNNRIFTTSQFNIVDPKYGADVMLISSERIGLQSFLRMTDTISAGYVDILGGQTDGFTPIIRFHPMNASTGSGNVNSFIYADGPDTGSVAALVISSRNLSAGTLTTQPILDIRNGGTSVVKIAADGSITNSFLAGSGNRVLYASSAGLIFPGAIDATPTNGSTNAVQSDGVFDALALKQNSLTLTTTGTSGASTLVGATLNIPQYSGGGGGSGTVTSVSVVTANGVSGSVADATTTPAITLTLGAITPTTVNGNTITTGTGVLTLGAGKTLTASNTITFTATDGSTLAIGTGGTLGTNAYTSTAYAPLASPTFSTSITGSYLTASEILITNGSKNIISAPVATYPSLTELTYVKGVTSAIQTQINAKGAGTVTSVGFTGGLISVATATTTPAFTVAGTSGGVPYFSSTSAWASSGLLTASAIILGGGAGASPTSLALGTANQIVGMNNAGTANEYKTLSLGTTAQSNDLGIVLSGANAIVLHIPDASNTIRGVVTTGTQTFGGSKTFTLLSTHTGGIYNPGNYISASSTAASNWALVGGSTAGAVAAATIPQIIVESSAGSAYRGFMGGTTNYVITTADYQYGSFIIGNMPITERASGALTLASQFIVRPLTITNASGTTTNAATVYIEGAMTGVTPTGGNYTQWNKAGLSRFGGGILLDAGTATAGTAPLKFTTGTALTTPEDGAVEYHSSHLYFTVGSTRYQLDQQGGTGANALGTYIVQITTDAPANAQVLASLATGIVKNTTTTGVLSIAVAGDFPTLNQNTTGSAATLTTSRNINGTAFNGSADITVTAAAGTLTGTVLNATVVTSSLTAHGTITSGGLGTGAVIGGVTMTLGSDAANDIYYRNGSGILTRLANGTTGQFLSANTASAPSWGTPAGSGDVSKVGTPVNNQIGIWTGDGTIEGSTQLTFTGQALQLASTNTTQATTSSILAVAANSLTTGTCQYIASSTITTGNLLNLVTTGTAAAAGNEALNIDRSGANGTSSITVTGARITLANTGTTSTNVGMDIAVSGASTNTAITANSDVEITDTTKGVILKSPDGTRWRITVGNTGILTTTSL